MDKAERFRDAKHGFLMSAGVLALALVFSWVQAHDAAAGATLADVAGSMATAATWAFFRTLSLTMLALALGGAVVMHAFQIHHEGQAGPPAA